MRDKIGPTGEKPISDVPNDEGALNAAISTHGKFIKVEFGKELTFIVMATAEAMIFAEALQKTAGVLIDEQDEEQGRLEGLS